MWTKRHAALAGAACAGCHSRGATVLPRHRSPLQRQLFPGDRHPSCRLSKQARLPNLLGAAFVCCHARRCAHIRPCSGNNHAVVGCFQTTLFEPIPLKLKRVHPWSMPAPAGKPSLSRAAAAARMPPSQLAAEAHTSFGSGWPDAPLPHRISITPIIWGHSSASPSLVLRRTPANVGPRGAASGSAAGLWPW